jgi:hypothetical protein
MALLRGGFTRRMFEKLAEISNHFAQDSLRAFRNEVLVEAHVRTVPFDHQQMVRRLMCRMAAFLRERGLDSEEFQLPHATPEEIRTFRVTENLDTRGPCLLV